MSVQFSLKTELRELFPHGRYRCLDSTESHDI